jgi:hypothetical protein
MTGTLEGHWPLTEDTGSTAYDYSGNENHGDVTGAGPVDTGTVTGPFGNSAYSFDGSDDEIIFSSYSTFSEATLSAWVRPTGSNSEQAIISVDVNNNFYLRSTSGNWETFIFDGSSSHLATGNQIVYDEWIHLVADWDGSTLTLYENGVETASVSVSSMGSGNRTNYLGNSANTNRRIEGQLSDARIYSRALSPQEVQALYQAGRRAEAVFGAEVTK